MFARFEAEVRGDEFAGDTFGFVDVMTAPALLRMRALMAKAALVAGP